MLIETTDRELIDWLMESLEGQDAPAPHEAEGICRAYRRQEPRYPLRAACIVRGAVGESAARAELAGYTRNVSRRGLGLLLPGVLNQGEVVEVEVTPEGHPSVFMTGMVRYCRYAGKGQHEVGLNLIAVRSERNQYGKEGMPEEMLNRLRECGQRERQY
jgi:hypothetical protein